MHISKYGAAGVFSVAAAAAIAAGSVSYASTQSSGPVHASPNSPVSRSSTLHGAAQLAAARKVVQHKGYDSFDGQFWKTGHRLNALVGVLHESADGKYQRAFFFADGRYIGLDTIQPSASIHLVSASNDVITVSYGIYKPTDPLAAPSSYQHVRYEWTGAKLVPLDPIPPRASNDAPGR